MRRCERGLNLFGSAHDGTAEGIGIELHTWIIGPMGR